MSSIDISNTSQKFEDEDYQNWFEVLKTHIADTAKDFTIMMTIQTIPKDFISQASNDSVSPRNNENTMWMEVN